MKSSLGKFVSAASWLITGLVAVNEGAKAFGYDFYNMRFMINNPKANLYVHYVVGIAGVISLIMFVAACVSSVCGCCKKDSCEVVCPKCGVTPCVCPHLSSHHNKI